MKQSAIKAVKTTPADEPTLNFTQRKIRDRVKAMVEHGKDSFEAPVIVTLAEIVADVTHQENPNSTYFRSISANEKAKIRSLRCIAEEVLSQMRKSGRPDVWFHEPTFALYCTGFLRRDDELNSAMAYACKALGRRPKLRRRLKESVDDTIGRHEDLYLTIGFLIGLRAYKLGLQRELDNITTEKLEEYSIHYQPETELEKTVGRSRQ